MYTKTVAPCLCLQSVMKPIYHTHRLINQGYFHMRITSLWLSEHTWTHLFNMLWNRFSMMNSRLKKADQMNKKPKAKSRPTECLASGRQSQSRDRKRCPAGGPAHYDILLQAGAAYQLQFSRRYRLPPSPSPLSMSVLIPFRIRHVQTYERSCKLEKRQSCRGCAFSGKFQCFPAAATAATPLSLPLLLLTSCVPSQFLLRAMIIRHWVCPTFSFPWKQLLTTLIKDEGGGGHHWVHTGLVTVSNATRLPVAEKGSYRKAGGIFYFILVLWMIKVNVSQTWHTSPKWLLKECHKTLTQMHHPFVLTLFHRRHRL